MFEPAQLLTDAQWSGILTIVVGILAVLGFVLKWGFRFRLVGITGFMAVLTTGIFALSLAIYTRPNVPGAVHYSRIFDTASSQVVIVVPATVTEPQVEATLRQAAIDLYSPGRMSQGEPLLTIRLRTNVHPEPGVSEPLYLGEIQRSLAVREDADATVKIYRENFARLPQPVA
ncbi:MAG: Ycf51 family protein [Phormidesmis sp. CAN_BIN44]|nr:Ycf51 family protein [Phormidesmis sp. CAN_BIN44]